MKRWPRARHPRLAAYALDRASCLLLPSLPSRQDEFKPRLIEALTGRITVPANAVVAAGQTASFCTIVGGQLFAWGKLKPSGEAALAPPC